MVLQEVVDLRRGGAWRDQAWLGTQAIKVAQLCQVVGGHLTEDRLLEGSGVADFVAVPLHHTVFALVDPARGKQLEPGEVHWQM